MTTKPVRINIPGVGQPALTLSGRLETHSTRRLHTHAYHQVLVIHDGVSLLVDSARKQPLFGAMTAFIPAGLPHRSTVMGQEVGYKSLYFAPELFAPGKSEISIFNISTLGAALFNHINIRHAGDLAFGLNRECLDLFLKILPEDMARPADLVRLPEPSQLQNRKVVDFIEQNYSGRLTMGDFSAAFPYSGRHLTRIFKADLKITVFEYVRLYRVLMASIRMSDASRTITEVVYDSGYESISSFYRDFNLIFAVTPKAFQDRMRRCST
ncbi:MAG: helix-turn-helix domain-containing protein [Syntrophobacteraceae bacterium]